MKTKTRYYVYYGHCTSRYSCSTLAEVHAFVSYCLREGKVITGISKA